MGECTVLGADFDMTIADTFTPPIGGLGVPEAYERAVGDIFGPEAWGSIGGFANQAPIEIGEKLCDQIGLDQFVLLARDYYTSRQSELDAVMPLDSGAIINGRDGDTLNGVVEVMVRRKLELLLPNVGQPLEGGGMWPKLMPGFEHFWRRVTKNPEVVTAIISSGHDVFIENVLAQHRLPRPDIIISDDYMRRKGLRFYKPNPMIWEYVLQEVRGLGHQPISSIYIGDSRSHDGGLARNALIDFMQFAGPESAWHGHKGTFDDWKNLSIIELGPET